jgi:hypothetical protein
MNLYAVDINDEPLVILAKSKVEAREKLIFYGAKKGFSKSWRENANIHLIVDDGHGVYEIH